MSWGLNSDRLAATHVCRTRGGIELCRCPEECQGPFGRIFAQREPWRAEPRAAREFATDAASMEAGHARRSLSNDRVRKGVLSKQVLAEVVDRLRVLRDLWAKAPPRLAN